MACYALAARAGTFATQIFLCVYQNLNLEAKSKSKAALRREVSGCLKESPNGAIIDF
jgi:hypothetical protein